MRGKANWARAVVAVFTMAIFYASVCSASCAVGVCPEQAQRTTGHNCNQMPTHHTTPDCSQHPHPELFLAKSGSDLPQFQPTVVDQLQASTTSFLAQYGLLTGFNPTRAAEHAPPDVLSIPFYDRISVLRI